MNDELLDKKENEYQKWHKQSEERMDKVFNESMELTKQTIAKLDSTEIEGKIDASFNSVYRSIDTSRKPLKILLIAIILIFSVIVISIITFGVSIASR